MSQSHPSQKQGVESEVSSSVAWVGAVVRARVPGYPKATRRAIVVHVHPIDSSDYRGSHHGKEVKALQNEQLGQCEESTTAKVDLLWEDDFVELPYSQEETKKGSGRYFLSSPFWVISDVQTQHLAEEITDFGRTVGKEDDHDAEITVSLTDIFPLLDFERTDWAGISTAKDSYKRNKHFAKQDDDKEVKHQEEEDKMPVLSVAAWKERGDRLLAVGDAFSAMPYYQQALLVAGSCNFSVGGSVVLQERTTGHVKMAEVDCISPDENDSSKINLDVVILPSGAERTVPEQDILLCRSETTQEHLQERILCNITRCFLQVSQIDSTSPKCQSSQARKVIYAKAAILASTVAYTLAHHDHTKNSSDTFLSSQTLGSDSSKLAVTSLLLRSQAYSIINKLQHALQDVNRILTSYDPHHKEAKMLQTTIQRQKKEQAKLDKRLVKDMCSWIQQQQQTSSTSADTETSSATTMTMNSSSFPVRRKSDLSILPEFPIVENLSKKRQPEMIPPRNVSVLFMGMKSFVRILLGRFLLPVFLSVWIAQTFVLPFIRTRPTK